jgi:hypothetical protein
MYCFYLENKFQYIEKTWIGKSDDFDLNQPSWIGISQRQFAFHLSYWPNDFLVKISIDTVDMLKLVVNSDVIVVVFINCCEGWREI